MKKCIETNICDSWWQRANDQMIDDGRYHSNSTIISFNPRSRNPTIRTLRLYLAWLDLTIRLHFPDTLQQQYRKPRYDRRWCDGWQIKWYHIYAYMRYGIGFISGIPVSLEKWQKFPKNRGISLSDVEFTLLRYCQVKSSLRGLSLDPHTDSLLCHWPDPLTRLP